MTRSRSPLTLADELDAVLSAPASRPVDVLALTLAELDSLDALDSPALLRCACFRSDVEALAVVLADRLASALESVEQLEALLRLDTSCPVARNARRAGLH